MKPIHELAIYSASAIVIAGALYGLHLYIASKQPGATINPQGAAPDLSTITDALKTEAALTSDNFNTDAGGIGTILNDYLPLNSEAATLFSSDLAGTIAGPNGVAANRAQLEGSGAGAVIVLNASGSQINDLPAGNLTPENVSTNAGTTAAQVSTPTQQV